MTMGGDVPDGGLAEGRIQRLRERWQADPSSRLFLQLAEEYRRTGRMDEAIAVLEKGLQHHPNYLSAKVALARCHLETGKPEQAADVLRVVVEQDPTQLVANKLLVEAYVAMDEDQLAGKALDAYMALNRSDPEIEQLDQRIEAMRSDEDETSGDAREAEQIEPREVGLVSSGEAQEEAVSPPYVGREDGSVPDPAHEQSAREVTMGVSEPFPGLYADRERLGWMRALSAPGLFPVAAWAGASVAEAEQEALPVEDGEVSPGIAVSGGVAAPHPELPATGEDDETGEAETVTLGGLYLDQGHPGEAAAIFRRVIDRDPANVVALNGLAEAERRLHRSEDSVLPEPRPEDGINARKIRRLREYLMRLRRGSGGHVS